MDSASDLQICLAGAAVILLLGPFAATAAFSQADCPLADSMGDLLQGRALPGKSTLPAIL